MANRARRSCRAQSIRSGSDTFSRLRMFKTWAMVTACVCTFGLIGKVVGEPVGEFVLSEYATATPELAPPAAENELNYVEARGEGLASQTSGLKPSRPSTGLSGTHRSEERRVGKERR